MSTITTGAIAKLLWPGLNARWGNAYAERAKEWTDLVDTEDSSMNYEEDQEMTGFGLAPMFNTPQCNATGHPAISVPLGRDEVGVPFGLQIIGPRWRDDRVLGLAEVWEQLRPWPTVAPGFDPFPLPSA